MWWRGRRRALIAYCAYRRLRPKKATTSWMLSAQAAGSPIPQGAQMRERGVGIAHAPRRADVVPAPRRVRTDAVRKATRGEAVRHHHDVATPDQFLRPAPGGAARARTEAAAVVHDHHRETDRSPRAWRARPGSARRFRSAWSS